MTDTQWHMGTHLRVLSKSYLMKTNMTEDGFKKSLHTCALDKVTLALEGLLSFCT